MIRAAQANRANAGGVLRPAPKRRSPRLRRGWQAAAALLFLQSLAAGQIATPGRVAASKPADTSHAERCLAAIDLAVVAAESGIVDVSIEAMRRATQKGPPVASMELGGLLGAKPNPNARAPQGNTINIEAASAQAKLAKRLLRLHEVWRSKNADPVQGYQAFKLLVLPEGRPSEAFAYSVTAVPPQATSYSNIDFDVEQPKLIECGAAALVEWARLAHKEDDLLGEVNAREGFTGAAGASLLVKVILAQDASRPAAEAEALCEKISGRAKMLVDAPDAALVCGQVWKMLDRLPPDAPQRGKLFGAVLAALEREQNWATNEWMLFFVAKGLRDSLDEGDARQFRRYADVAISRYNPIRANNVDYVASQEAAMYGVAARRAFEAGQLKLAADCLRLQGQLPVAQTYLQSQSDVILDPTQAVAQALLTMDRAERYELLKGLVWNMPELGLSRAARMNTTDRIPPLFLASAAGGPALPWREVAGAKARSVSLLEWTMRDAIALSKQADIAAEIAKLEAKGSDDARLARLVFGLAQDKPADLTLLTKTAADGVKTLRPTLGEGGGVLPLDIDVVEQALAQDEYRAAGVKLLDQLLAMAIAQHQDLYVTLTRAMKFRLREEPPAATDRDLAHWVVADDVSQSDFTAGHAPTSLWVRRGDNAWGQEFGTNFSTLLFRYPLAGNYSISFRALDGTYVEGGATLGGRIVEFLEYQKRLQFWGVGLRNTVSLDTDALKNDQFNTIRLERKPGSLAIHVGDGFQKDVEVPEGDFPFFGMCAHHFRETSFDMLKIDGEVTIPRSVDMLSPTLLGWTARFKNQRLPPFVVLPDNGQSQETEEDKIDYDWRLVDGALESVNHQAIDKEKQKKPTAAAKGDKHARPRREGVIQYLRPLCDGEEVALEFYFEPGKYALAPALGRVAMLLSDAKPGLHWITADSSGTTTGIDDANRVVDDQAEQLKPIALKDNAWNQMALRLAGGVVTLSINGEAIYRRKWEAEAGRQFGLFHDPTQYHVRVRNLRLSGDWPEKLPADLFELKPKGTLTSVEER